MSVASEIARLSSAKAALKTAIEGKGVTVPSVTKLDGYAPLVASIASGGTYPEWMKDGDTHLWLEILNHYQFEQHIRIRMIGTIDWGDGSEAQSVNVTTYTDFSHTYATTGRYRIDLHPTSGTFYLGGANSSYCIMGTRAARYNVMSALYQCEIGSARITTISTYAFYYCYGLKRVYVPKTIVTTNNYGFAYCYGLSEIEFEDSSTITSTGSSYLFYYCYALQELHGYAPPHQTSVSYTYRYCGSLSEIILPATVTSVGAYSISSVSGLKVLYCLPTNPPTISTATNFSPPSVCSIKVPNGSLTAYQEASIWADYASQIVEAWTITMTLTNVSSSNRTPMADKNASYTTTLTAFEGYTLGTVTVMMGGLDITSTAYSDGVVSIASVTGNVTITATATS